MNTLKETNKEETNTQVKRETQKERQIQRERESAGQNDWTVFRVILN